MQFVASPQPWAENNRCRYHGLNHGRSSSGFEIYLQKAEKTKILSSPNGKFISGFSGSVAPHNFRKIVSFSEIL